MSSAPATTVTPDQVARQIAPQIRLHPQDPHRPCSVEWFLQRCDVVSGSAAVPDTGPIDLPQGLTRTALGPLTGDALAAASSSQAFGGGEIDGISLLPLWQGPGADEPETTPPDWSDPSLQQAYFTDILEQAPASPPSASQPYFSTFQLETLAGQNTTPSRAWTSPAPIYCRIAQRWDYYLISYFGFFAYNGGLGARSSYTSRPLDLNAGWDAHIGDWIRITAQVTISDGLVSIGWVDLETHGDQQIVHDFDVTSQPLSSLKRIVAYSAWHSHELYDSAGVHPRVEAGFVANDYTADGGPLWDTQSGLQFVSDDGPAWIRYNGLWGANMTVSGLVRQGLKNGPQGPAFHWYWTHEDKAQTAPVSQWRDPQTTPLAAPTGLTWDPSIVPNVFGVQLGSYLPVSWQPVAGATGYVVRYVRAGSEGDPSGAAVSQQYVTGTSANYKTTLSDDYQTITVVVSAVSDSAPPSPRSQAPQAWYISDGHG